MIGSFIGLKAKIKFKSQQAFFLHYSSEIIFLFWPKYLNFLSKTIPKHIQYAEVPKETSPDTSQKDTHSDYLLRKNIFCVLLVEHCKLGKIHAKRHNYPNIEIQKTHFCSANKNMNSPEHMFSGD